MAGRVFSLYPLLTHTHTPGCCGQGASHQRPPMPSGCSWPLAFRWKVRVSGLDGGGSVQGSPPRGAACLGRCLPHPSFRGRLFWKATTSGDSGSLVLFFCRLVVILLHSQLLWASRFSQKSPCKSHQIAAGDVWWHGSEVNLSFIKRKRRFYIHLV